MLFRVTTEMNAKLPYKERLKKMKVKELRKAIEKLDGEKEVRIISNASDSGVANISKVAGLYMDDEALLINLDNRIGFWYSTGAKKL